MPGYSSPIEYFCIKNVGGAQVTLSALADELTDVDVACTGDEAASGDTTCGGGQVGELSSVVGVGMGAQACANAGAHSGSATTLESWATNPTALGTLAGGATGCYSVRASYASNPDNVDVQKAQSDRATWRFKFTAQA